MTNLSTAATTSHALSTEFGGGLGVKFPHLTLAGEVVLIGEFALFWHLQTHESQNLPKRRSG